MSETVRILTYNIRKGKGASGRAQVPMQDLGGAIKDHPVDLVLCQEVFHSTRTGASQSAHLAEAMGLESYYGANKFREVGHHGNTTLTRLSVEHVENHDISTNRVERRGSLYLRVRLGEHALHVFNVHLGLNEGQRRKQVEQLARLIDDRCRPHEPVLLAGDFNDWRRRLGSIIEGQLGFTDAFAGHDAEGTRTWHARRPLFALDRIYVRNLHAEHAARLTGHPWIDLSDHLPLWAELRT